MGDWMDQPSDVITIAYDCTAREQSEGKLLLAATKNAAGQGARKRIGLGRGMAGWLLFVCVAILMFAYEKQYGLRPSRPFVGAQPTSVAGDDDEAEPTPTLVKLSYVGLTVGLCCVFATFACIRLAYKLERKRFKGREALSITPSGLVKSRPGYRSTIQWDTFLGVEAGNRVLVLRAGPEFATIIPKRLFNSEAQFDRALQLLRGLTTRPAIPLSSGFPVIQR